MKPGFPLESRVSPRPGWGNVSTLAGAARGAMWPAIRQAQRSVESNPHPPVCQTNGALADRDPRQRNRINEADSDEESAVSLDRLSIFRAVPLPGRSATAHP